MGEDRVGGKDGERGPDEYEAGELVAVEGLVEVGDAKEELTGWRDVLDEAECGEAHAAGGGGEPEKRDGGDDAGEREEGKGATGPGGE